MHFFKNRRHALIAIYCALALLIFGPPVVGIWRLNHALDQETRKSFCKEIAGCVLIFNEVQIGDSILLGTPSVFVQVTDESKIQKEAVSKKILDWVAKFDDSEVAIIYQQVENHASTTKSKRKI